MINHIWHTTGKKIHGKSYEPVNEEKIRMFCQKIGQNAGKIKIKEIKGVWIWTAKILKKYQNQ
jgi:hypothetical protein